MTHRTHAFAPTLVLADDARIRVWTGEMESAATPEGEGFIGIDMIGADYGSIGSAYCSLTAATALRDQLTAALEQANQRAAVTA